MLWGVFLSSALAQVAQFITSHDDVVARYIESHPPQFEQIITQAAQRSLVPPKLATDIQLSDEAMQSVSWPLSVFW
ncbi:hypothetical protein [Vibrio sp. J383]|uniref:hypothetical protein n=1 Tax=Vibrio sp. J383 TaxID=2942997 RepID=UPI0020BD5E92|nr:hypothetical protein [Vibrio sp. J383]UQV24912.1 hypothetical protein M4S28_25750 [Vibrio sp. J383]